MPKQGDVVPDRTSKEIKQFRRLFRLLSPDNFEFFVLHAKGANLEYAAADIRNMGSHRDSSSSMPPPPPPAPNPSNPV